MYFIGIDLGTTSVKIIVTDEHGSVIRTTSREYNIYFPKPLWSEQNPNDWYNETIGALKELLSFIEKSEVKAISFSDFIKGGAFGISAVTGHCKPDCSTILSCASCACDQ